MSDRGLQFWQQYQQEDEFINGKIAGSENELFKSLRYEPTTGIFHRATGRKVGTTHADGGIQISINGKTYQAHRLAWLYVRGEMPKGDIDHINGIRSDNRISNLRDVSRSVNLQNQRRAKNKDSSSGMLGVSINKATGKWVARIKANGKNIYLGIFKEKTEAYRTYLDAKRKLHIGCTI